MTPTPHNAMQLLVLATAFAVMPAPAHAQQPPAQSAVPSPTAGHSIVLDRVIAVVNGDTILESDVDEERRFDEIQPYRGASAFRRDLAIQRLIDRTLIIQQAELEPRYAVTDKELDAQLETLRRDIPDCKELHCETAEGWEKYVTDHGFSVEEFRDLWRKRMQLLRFIEVRFRSGITISDDQVKAYYDTTMLPEYAKRSVTPPKLDTISNRIQEVLLQQQVSTLLEDWLKSLRAQGSVRMITPKVVNP